MRRRHSALLAALATIALVVAGCGAPDGGSGDDAGAAGDPVAAVPAAEGVGVADSSGQAIAALGASGAEAPDEGAGTLDSYEAFGTPKDHFEQQVDVGTDSAGVGEPGAGSGAPADPGALVADVPQVADPSPLVAVPAGSAEPVPDPGASTTGPSEPGEPGAGEAPAEPARAMEADLDISGEPVIAREGDAIPPDTQQFVVERVGVKEILLKLNGGLLPDGSDAVTLAEGESVTLYNSTAKQSYRIKLVDLRPASG